VAGSWNTVVAMISGLQAALPTDHGSIPGRARDFSFLYQSGSIWAHSAFFSLPQNSMINFQIKTINYWYFFLS